MRHSKPELILHEIFEKMATLMSHIETFFLALIPFLGRASGEPNVARLVAVVYVRKMDMKKVLRVCPYKLRSGIQFTASKCSINLVSRIHWRRFLEKSRVERGANRFGVRNG